MERAAVLIAMGLLAWVGCATGSASPDHPVGGGGAGAGSAGMAGQGGGAAGGSGGASFPARDAANDTETSDAGDGGAAPDVGDVESSDAAPMSDAPAVSVGPRTNLALRKPATASSVEHAGHEPEMIDDGDQVTRWVGGSAIYPQWNQIDLQASHRIDTAVLYPYMARAYQFLLEGSLDGASYFTLSDRRDNTTGGDAITVSFAAQSARFVRITVVGASVYTSGWTAINELQLYEAP